MSISSNLHFANNEIFQWDDLLHKIRLIIDMITKVFKELYMPGKDVSLDEFLLKCKSRISCIQYKKSKSQIWHKILQTIQLPNKNVYIILKH